MKKILLTTSVLAILQFGAASVATAATCFHKSARGDLVGGGRVELYVKALAHQKQGQVWGAIYVDGERCNYNTETGPGGRDLNLSVLCDVNQTYTREIYVEVGNVNATASYSCHGTLRILDTPSGLQGRFKATYVN